MTNDKLTKLLFFFYLFIQASSGYSQTQKTIAVLPFQTLGNFKNVEIYSYGFPAAIQNDLAQYPQIKIVERLRLISIINEIKLQQAGFLENKEVIGKMSGATHLLLGNVQKINNLLRISIQLTSVKTSQIEASVILNQKINNIKDIFRAEDYITLKLINKMGLSMTDKIRQDIEKMPTNSMAAFDYYSKGLSCFYQHEIKKAINYFKQAKKHDENFYWINEINKKAISAFQELDNDVKNIK